MQTPPTITMHLKQAISIRSPPSFPSPKPSYINGSLFSLHIFAVDASKTVSSANLQNMAITFNEFSFRSQASAIGNPRGLFFMVFSSICGLLSLILALAAEATRSEATWMLLSDGQRGQTYQCVYNSSGRTPLTWAVVAFLLLAVAMFMQQAHILVALSGARPPAAVANPLPHEGGLPASVAHPLPRGGGLPAASSPLPPILTWKASCFFFMTWVSFVITEVLLMIGIGVESAHLNRWKVPRYDCPVVRPGLFAAAGLFGLATVLLGPGLYLAAFRATRPHPSSLNWHPGILPPHASMHHDRLPQCLHAAEANANQAS